MQLCGLVDECYVLDFMISRLGGYDGLSQMLLNDRDSESVLADLCDPKSSAASKTKRGPFVPTPMDENALLQDWLKTVSEQNNLVPERVLEPRYRTKVTNKDVKSLDAEEVKRKPW
jgi:hypothetical protein